MSRKRRPRKSLKTYRSSGGYYRRRKRLGPSLARKAYKLAKEATKSIEMKRVTQTSSTGTPMGADVKSIYIGPVIAKGDLNNQRVGGKVRVQSVALRWIFNKHASAAAKPVHVRVIFFIDRRNNAEDFSAAYNRLLHDSTDGTGSGTPGNFNLLSPYRNNNPEFRGRFQVLEDKTYSMNENVETKVGKLFHNRPFDMVYKDTATGGAATDLMKGGLGAIFIYRENQATTYYPSGTVTAVYKYTDS